LDNTQIRNEIENLIQQYMNNNDNTFIPGETPILTGQAIYDHNELNAIINTLLDGWFGLGQKGVQFEKEFAAYFGFKSGCLANSGSSANLVALNALKLKRNLAGGEIITIACAFPTTLNPIIQLGFKPAFIDVDHSLNINPEMIEQAIASNTVGISFSHTLGNPAKVAEIKAIAERNKLFIIEDCCDALGSKYQGQLCGTFGNCATFSFYPAHGMTLGEGGIIITDDPELNKVAKSLRDWGRDCYCSTDEKNLDGKCGKRFDYELDGIPYDHKYIYSNIGYNLKPLEMQAAMGLEQLKKLNQFNLQRQHNYRLYVEAFKPFAGRLDLPVINAEAKPVFFGLPLIINDPAINRQALIKYLNDKKIATRLLFGGNLLKHPAYKNIAYAQYSTLDYTDKLMRDCFWIGIHPGVNQEVINYVADTIDNFIK
jgi:CDP-4-dehydro-6-deoxyglucose reductase, E1